MSSDLDKRITKLEEQVQNQAKLVDQITGYLFTPKKAKAAAKPAAANPPAQSSL
jgi:uncharacterized coiled-coil protein SlyX